MNDRTPSIEKLEKQLQGLKKKLERSEQHRVDLENQHDRDQHLYRRLHIDLEAAHHKAQIEAALERVRGVAMAMRTPDDLSGISETVFTELKALGFTDLRNTEIIINHDTEESVTSYYYSDYGVTGVIDVAYNTNPTLAAWARDMQQADDAFAEVVIAEDEMEAWRAYRLSLGYVPDPRLDEAASVYYYSYSIGLGALSISSFQPVDAEHLKMLAQFRNVFNLAYQRYVDIARAEAQAREAQIEAALERVRSRTMAMQTSDELPQAANLLFRQVQALGMPAWSAGYCIWDDDKQGITLWMSSEGVLQPPVRAPLTEDPAFIHMREAHQRGETFYVEEMGGDALVQHYRYLRTLPVVGDVLDSIIEAGHPLPTFQIFHLAYFSSGFLLFITYEPVPKAYDIFKRFGKVFEQTYTRFLDLKQAEAQAREAEIELALERVRARTMAMQKSTEISEVAHVLFQQLQHLGGQLWGTGFAFCTTESDADEFWFVNQGGILPPVTIPNTEDPVHIEMYEGWKNEKALYTEEKGGEELIAHYKYMLTVPDVRDFFKGILESGLSFPTWQKWHAAYFSHGYLLVITVEPYEEERIFIRFAKVFEQAYTRFRDLQRAEAQARDAQIEASLERVRSRAMAMHSSDDLSDATAIVFTELERLGISTVRCGINIIHDSGHMDVWTATATTEDKDLRILGRLDKTMHPMLESVFEAWKAQQPFFTYELAGEDMQAYYLALKNAPDYAFPQDARPSERHFAYAFYFPEGALFTFAEQPLAAEYIQIFKRFTAVFAQTYRRYLDLKKAEEQLREAQIEAALERTRTQSMLMQHSDELIDISKVFHEQLLLLGVDSEFSYVWLPDEEHDKHMFWATWAEEHNGSTMYQSKSVTYDLDRTEPYTAACFAAWESSEPVHISFIPPDEVDPFFATWEALLHGAENLKAAFFPEGIYYAEAYMKYGCFGINIRRRLAEDEQQILRRFAVEFERAYTRFLDLQKAEAQAREAQIEASLERVRARAMAMHSSDDLSDATAVVFTELEKLGISTLRCGIVIIDETRHMDTWTATATSDDKDVRIVGRIDTTIHPLLEGVFESWKVQQPFFTYELAGEDLQSYYQALRNAPDYAFPQDARPSARQFHYTFFFPEGALFTFSEQPLAEEPIQIFKRFAAVFALTYRRYLDLKQAEEQAREAQIEAALERVRSRTMAMQRPDELQEVVTLVAERLLDLGVIMDAGGVIICTYFPNSKDVLHWLASPDFSSSKPYLLPYFDHPIFNDAWSSREGGDEFFSKAFSVEEKNSFFLHAFEHSDYKYFPDEFKELVLAAEHHALTFAWSKNAAILIPSFTDIFPSESDKEILKRFARVFEQAYIRFLDLQQAEAQTREAQIETALERVRSRTMAMQNSEELSETSALLFDQIKELGIETWTSGFNIWEDDERACIGYNATPAGGIGVPIRLPLTEDPFFKTIYEAKKRDEEFLMFESEGESLVETYRYMFTLPVVKDVMQGIVDSGFDLPEYQVTHCCFFSHGHLMFITLEPHPDAWDVFKRFTKVFEQTYTRFLDLKKSEAQAQQARQQASLDRVRAEIASMRTTADLERITPLVWRELTTLGVPFFRCGVFIIDEAAEAVQVFLTTPEGKALAALPLGFNDAPIVRATVAHWRQEAVYTEEWDAAQMRDWTQFLQERGLIETSTRYLDAETPPEHLALHLVPFAQGMLYVGSKEPLDAEAIESVQALADAFAVAYARYEDFQRLEAKNREVEVAMDELKAAQQQLVHAEKMASLGALTAGIAHEIKNPLNFINNFAEVNEELTVELREDLADHPDALAAVEDLIADLKQNAAVIAQHGKRADGIVRSMMQHARGGEGRREAIDLNTIVAEYVDLAFHGKRAQVPGFNAEIEKDLDAGVGRVVVVPQEIGRVLLNLIGNAFDAVYEHATRVNGGYVPTVTVSTRQVDDHVEIKVEDNGPGIPTALSKKIFEPFFTTKPTGTGTGLGLSLSYDIVTQGHGGMLTLESKEGEGATFIVTLPVNSTETAASA